MVVNSVSCNGHYITVTVLLIQLFEKFSVEQQEKEVEHCKGGKLKQGFLRHFMNWTFI